MNKKKLAAMVLACMLVFGAAVGGTLAWLIDESDDVVNTFTDSNVDIELKETEKDFKMVPGWTIDKDPVVTVKAGSEDCWVFIEVEKSDNLDNYITYDIDSNNWTLLKETDNIYYCYAKDIENDRAIRVLGYKDEATGVFHNNKVLVKDTVTKEMMEAIDGVNADGNPDATEKHPTLAFKAYAVQLYKSNGDEFTPAEAWAKINPTP